MLILFSLHQWWNTLLLLLETHLLFKLVYLLFSVRGLLNLLAHLVEIFLSFPLFLNDILLLLNFLFLFPSIRCLLFLLLILHFCHSRLPMSFHLFQVFILAEFCLNEISPLDLGLSLLFSCRCMLLGHQSSPFIDIAFLVYWIVPTGCRLLIFKRMLTLILRCRVFTIGVE